MSKKADVIEAKGTIYKESGNGYFNVELEEPEGHQCLCRASGKAILGTLKYISKRSFNSPFWAGISHLFNAETLRYCTAECLNSSTVLAT